MISIIVPIYNGERYLCRCLDSLLNQGIDEQRLEIICIDDGSRDRSLDIVQRYASLHSSITVHTQPHGGAAAARNVGLEVSRGEVVTFCDADDYLIPGGLGYLLKNFWSQEVDVLCHGSITLDKQRLKVWKEDYDVTGEIRCEGTGRDVYQRDPKYFVWNTLIRRSYIEKLHLRFEPHVMCEDAIFLLELLMGGARAIDVSANIYRYTVNEHQVTRQREPKVMRQCIEDYMCYIGRLRHYGWTEVVKTQTKPFYSRCLSAQLSKVEWDSLRPRMKEMGLTTWCYPLYASASYIYRHLFVPYILPRLRRG